jgi:hypothetical protein
MAEPRSAPPPAESPRRKWVLVAVAAAVAAAVAGTAWLSPDGWSLGSRQRAAVVLDPDAVRVVRTPGGMLEVATLEKNEEFGWRVAHTCPLLDCAELLGSTTSHVRVTAHYTYRIPLAATWTLAPRRDGRYELRVPALEPAEPVAFDTRGMQVRTERTRWLSPAAAPNREAVVRHLGPELARRARQDHYLRLAEEGAAATVTEFAQRWMREQGQPPLGAALTVRFGKSEAQSH